MKIFAVQFRASKNVEGAILNVERYRSALATLRASEWVPMTAVRVLIGIFFCISGGTKLLVPAQFSMMERTLAASHFRPCSEERVASKESSPDGGQARRQSGGRRRAI
jgi:hypothetical protein